MDESVRKNLHNHNQCGCVEFHHMRESVRKNLRNHNHYHQSGCVGINRMRESVRKNLRKNLRNHNLQQKGKFHDGMVDCSKMVALIHPNQHNNLDLSRGNQLSSRNHFKDDIWSHYRCKWKDNHNIYLNKYQEENIEICTSIDYQYFHCFHQKDR